MSRISVVFGVATAAFARAWLSSEFRTGARLDTPTVPSIVGRFPGTASKEDVVSRIGMPLPGDPVSWWRNSYERDRSAFERAHGRQPETLFELSSWLARIPIRAEPRPKSPT